MLQKYLYTDRLDPVHARNSSANASAMAPMSWKNTTLRYHLWIRILAMVSLEWLRFLRYFWVKKKLFVFYNHYQGFFMKDIGSTGFGGFFRALQGLKKKPLEVSRSPRQLLRRKARPEKSSCAQNHQRVIALVNQRRQNSRFSTANLWKSCWICSVSSNRWGRVYPIWGWINT